jgi:hypothetical protein
MSFNISFKTALACAVVIAGESLISSLSMKSASGAVEKTAGAVVEMPRQMVSKLARIPDDQKRMAAALNDFKRIAADGNRITKEDVERANQSLETQFLNDRMEALRKIDNNKDSVFTLEELQAYRALRKPPGTAGEWFEKNTRVFKKYLVMMDRNNDGKVTEGEARIYHLGSKSNFQNNKVVDYISSRYDWILTLDRNRDGAVTREEYLEVIAQIVPNQEREQTGLHNIRIVEPGCKLPEPEAGEQLILVSTKTGLTLSDVTTFGQDDIVSAVTIEIEEGDEPLYLLLSSIGSVLWKLSGATNRVSRVVVSSELRKSRARSASGVAGVPAEKVGFVSRDNCLEPTYGAGGEHETKIRRAISNITGRELSQLAAAEKMGAVTLPSGQVETYPRSYDLIPKHLRQNRAFTMYFPRGILKVDPTTVVSLFEAEKYEVLPGAAGIQQLISDGTLEQTGNSNYRVTKATRIPVSMTGNIEVIVPKGVPRPQGNLNSMCLVFEGTGERLGTGGKCNKP